MITAKFKKLYFILNADQKRAVDAIDGPVMVVAGPGTGKTQVLTLRIANILLKTDVRPDNILALTFTDAGAFSMRRRLAECVGGGAYSVNISTFHSFCQGVIDAYPEYFPRIIGSDSITEVEQIEIIENLLETLSLAEILRPFGDPFYYLKPILSNVKDLKREGVSPEKFAVIIKQAISKFHQIGDLYHIKGAHKGKLKGEYQKLLKQLEKNKELVIVYASYQEELLKRGWYDYEDMIMEVLRALETNPDLLLILQEQYQYFLVDEHQDTNNAQNKILELLCNFHPNPNIFVVGDEKQAIFRFQGASLENFLYFKKLYPAARMIVLRENYRSTQLILDSAESLLASQSPLKSRSVHIPQKIRLSSFSSPEAELYFLAKDISQKIASGVPSSEIAILYRDNRDALPIGRFLEKLAVPFVIESDQDILEDHNIRKLILLFEAVEKFSDSEKVLEAMHVDFLGIDPIDLYQLALETKRGKLPVVNLLRKSSIVKISAFGKKLSNWISAGRNLNTVAFFEEIVRESGYLNYILSRSDAIEEIDKLIVFFNELKVFLERHRQGRLKDFLNYLETLKKHQLLIKKRARFQTTEKARLMTAHKSKGQEFDFVYIVNAFDGHWGNRRRAEVLALPVEIYQLTDDVDLKNRGQESQLADERRLFYVALTRARKEVSLSYARFNSANREQLSCQFIQEINQELIEEEKSDFWENNFLKEKEILFAPPQAQKTSLRDGAFVKELFLDRGLSVTALNNYLTCPWRYFYDSLLLFPKAPSRDQMYGSAMHHALKDFFDGLSRRDPLPDKLFLADKFQVYLKKEPLTEKDFSESLKRGRKTLLAYQDYWDGRWQLPAKTEFNVPGVIIGENIRLTGKLDKIEFLESGINVVDYKTSQPKTRGEIEGKTKNSDGNLKRQLVFYKLLLDRFENGRYRMISGEIDFIHPDEKGRFRKEKFIIEKEEIVELENLIKKIAQEIQSLNFWNKRCGDQECRYCQLREVMS